MICSSTVARLYNRPPRTLYEAASDGNCKKLKKLLRAGAAVNSSNAEGETALLAAVSPNNYALSVYGENANIMECIDLLIEAGADVNVKTLKGRTALMNAAEGGFIKCVKFLLAAGADVNEGRMRSGATALILASCHGHYEYVDMLLKAGTDVNATDNEGSTALSVRRHLCVAEENIVHISKLLLRAGIHINKCRSSGYNALVTVIHGTAFTEAPLILYAAGETLDGAHEDDIPKELKFQKEKLELKHICREAIRKHLLKLDPHQHLLGRIPKLDVPLEVNEYLLFNVSLETGDGDDYSNDAGNGDGASGDDDDDDDESDSDYEEDDDTDDSTNDDTDEDNSDDDSDGDEEDNYNTHEQEEPDDENDVESHVDDSDDDINRNHEQEEADDDSDVKNNVDASDDDKNADNDSKNVQEEGDDNYDEGHVDDSDDETVDDDIFYQVIAQDKQCSL